MQMKSEHDGDDRCKNEECERGTDPAPENIAMMSAVLGLAGRGMEERRIR